MFNKYDTARLLLRSLDFSDAELLSITDEQCLDIATKAREIAKIKAEKTAREIYDSIEDKLRISSRRPVLPKKVITKINSTYPYTQEHDEELKNIVDEIVEAGEKISLFQHKGDIE